MHDALRRDVAKQVQPFRTQHRGRLEVSTGVEILGERSIDRTGHMAGDWIERLDFTATGWFARCMQHEFDHLNGTLYVDRLDGRWLKKARKAVKANGWGTPGLTWMPGVDPDPFGHDDLSLIHI